MEKEQEVTNGMVNEELNEATANSSTKKTLLQELTEMRASNLVGTPEFTAKMRELEVLLGVSEISPFGTNEMEIFEENLAEMSFSDMQKLAMKVGVNAYAEKPILKKSLIREFAAYTKNSRRNIMPSKVESFIIDPDNPQHKKLIKILNDV